MTARYTTKVHAENLAAQYGIPVTVYAENRQQAVKRAIEIAWSGRPQDARVRVLQVDDMPPMSQHHTKVEDDGDEETGQ